MIDPPKNDFDIFTAALELPADERAAYLEGICANDLEMRQRISVLLQAHIQGGDFLAPSAQMILSRVALSPLSLAKPGDRIGRYKLLKQIGEGGCGVVYMAGQEEPVQRQVALKIIKPGMDTKKVVARFEAERQVLALMDHPNIAKVFDGGATDSGRPYFVMELVRGVKITEYCDQNSLTIDDRLELFVHVCQAVQHAHQKGIIHRDIKPSNILVTKTLEDAALPMVIDFGIAKAITGQRLAENTIFTASDVLIGTPAYMSPEQAGLTGEDVDTRADIYSLGILLYELLTGSTPFDGGQMLKFGLDEVRRVIREEEPVRPSTRLSRLPEAELRNVAKCRRSEPPVLIRAVRGDLDWILMKSIEKDRRRRYETVNGLARDVQRYLADETISAHPPSSIYKLQKMVLRNKFLFAGLGGFLLVLILSLIVVSASFAKERQSRRESEVERAKAQTEAVKSQQTTKFLEQMLQGVGPSVALGQDTTMLRAMLDLTAERVGTEMTNQPAVEAELRTLIGRLYEQIGRHGQAEEMHRLALTINRKLYGSDSMEVAASLNSLGVALLAESKLSEAEEADGKALAIRRRLFGAENADTATSLNDLSAVYRDEGRLKEAEPMARQALEIRRKLFGKAHLDIADSLRNLSIILGDEGKWVEAEATAREVLAMRMKLLGPNHPFVASALDDVAWAAHANGKLDEADGLQREALAMRQKLLPADDPNVANSLRLVGDSNRELGKLDESYSVLNAAISIQRKVLGGEDPATLETLHSLGLTLESQQKWLEAENLWSEVLAIQRKRAGDGDPKVLYALRDLGRTLDAEEKRPEAEAVHREELTAWRKRPENEDLQILYTLNTLRLTLEAQGKLAEVETVNRSAVAVWERRAGVQDSQTLYALRDLAATLGIEGKWSEAESVNRAALASWRKLLGNQDPQTLYTLDRLSLVLEAQGKWSESEQTHRQATASTPPRQESEPWPPLSELGNLANGLIAQKKYGAAEKLLNNVLTPLIASQPSSETLLALRCDLRARRGQWQGAADDAALAFERQPADPRYSVLAALLVKTHNRPAYENFCRDILQAFGNTTNLYVADQVAKSCLFLPSPEVDLKMVGRLIDVTMNTNEAGDSSYSHALPYFQDCKALYEYRKGHYAEASEWAQKPLKVPRLQVYGHAYAVLAMASWHLGEKDGARVMLAKAEASAPSTMPASIAEDPSNAWQAWLFARIEVDEAAELIEPKNRTPEGNDDLQTLFTLRDSGAKLQREGKWLEAETACRAALAISRKKWGDEDPESSADLENLVNVLMAQKKFGEAEQLLGEVLTPAFANQSASANLLIQRVNLLGRQGRWQEAASDAEALSRLQPTDHYHYHRLAALLAITQNKMAYDRLCQKIVITFFSTTNAYVADRMAEDCLLMPHSSMDLQLIDKLADTAVALGGGDDLLPYIQGCKAMSAYRLGHFNEAIEWAEASIKNSHADVPAKVKAYAVLAMAYRQLGEKEAARAALIKGDTLAPNISSGQADKDLGEAWVAWVFAKVSLNEADSLTQATSITNRVPNELQ